MLLKPIQTVLNEAGVLPKRDNKTPVSEILDAGGLTLDSNVENLRELAMCPDNAIRLRATELVFKLHGVLKETEQGNVPTLNLVIKGDQNKIAAILEPRE